MNIKDYLCDDAVIIGLEAGNSEQVIRKLGGKLRNLGYVKENFIEAALEREANMPTGLPLGGEYNAAIPHVDIEYVNQSALGLATLKRDVVFYNMVENDAEVPCRLVIMLALDQPKSQIEMLQSVAAVLQDPEMVKKLVTAETAEDIFSILS
ncbi:MAG: PTS sugar transporter subunit IIA [Anaerolineales bacterium]|nr:PTS sugar transporter subunit IIA [Anaerolineales bacterium]